jgi:hypothetical protein
MEENTVINEVEVMKSYVSLLEKFKTLPPQVRRLPTLLQLSGYPHYENVCSNILRFLFDTAEVHGFENLMLKSLLQCANQLALAERITETEGVYREVVTDSGARIDLVIETEELAIAIENKIFHWLHNDLDDYQKFIEHKYQAKTERLFVVLSLRSESNLPPSYINITYEQFLPVVQANVGHHALNANSKYVILLLDFIETIRNLYMKPTVNEAMFNLIADNEHQIKELSNEHKKLLSQLYGTVSAISELVPERAGVKKWIWEKYVLVHDFTMKDNVRVAIDCATDFKKSEIEIFLRDKIDNPWSTLDQLNIIKDQQGNFKKSKRGYILFEKQIPFYELEPAEIAEVLNMSVGKVLKQTND